MAINNSKIEANGSSGGQTTSRVPASGGNSGGGSINIFYKLKYQNLGNIEATGGEIWGYGAATGGIGSISVGKILDGMYESTYTNY